MFSNPSKCSRARLCANMTSFVIVSELLFLLLIAASRSSRAAQSHFYVNLNLQNDRTHNQHLQRPPDWPIETNKQVENRNHHHHHLPASAHLLRANEKNHNIYLPQQSNLATASAKRRTGRTRRTKRSPRADRYEDGLALVASSTGLSASSATTSVPTGSHSQPQPQDEEETSRLVTSRPATNSDAHSLAAAELCYLASGGSSLTLTVNEATPVGSLIGTIDVNGDPSLEGGNVDLLDGLDQAASSGGSSAGGTFSSPEFASATTTAAAASVSGLTSVRQNRRLLGRRDTSDASEGVTPIAAALTSPFYALVGSTLATTTTGSPAATTTTVTNANQQQVAAVRVQPGTKNLLLARPLDKESPEGDSSLLVNVRCRARQSPVASNQDQNQDSNLNLNQIQTVSSNGGKQTGMRKQSVDATYTTIPIRLIVTDANDHAPEFVAPAASSPGGGAGLPYVINISETTPVGSIASRDILAIDKDSAGPHSTLHYRVLEPDDAQAPKSAANSFAFTNPLEPTLWLTGPLDYESLPAASFTLTIVAQDQGEPEPLQTSAQVQVNVLDFDDQNPKFLDEKYTLVMDEIQASLVGQNLRVLPRNLRAEDGDRGINAPILYSFDLSSSSSSSELADSRDRPLVELANDSAAHVAGGGSRAADPALNIEQYLHLNPTSGELRLIRQWPSGLASLPLTLVIRATQADNRDRYGLTTLTITRAAAGNALFTGGSSQSPHTATVAGGDTGRQTAGRQTAGGVAARTPNRGIEFAQERVTVQVPEDTPASEKIARVRAHHLTGGGHDHDQQADQGPASDPEIAIQKRRLMQLVASSSTGGDSGGGGVGGAATTQNSGGANTLRPINYQILDDQTDQFGINGLGEILLKRPLDYEQRQEFRFRVLATYTRYSDICHVHVQVVNVNDNKPKFAQSQYSFHLTESRLRSNYLGQVVAHDADLNDTIQYSILSAGPPSSSSSPSPQEQCARLFEISPAGQLSLRTSTRALNTSQCQIIVQASDSLVSHSSWHSKAHVEQHHQQQVRVNIYVAPQLIGRSLNLNALVTAPDHQQQQQNPGDHEAKLFSSRSLQAEGAGTSWRGGKFVASGRDQIQLAAESSTIASTNFQQPALPSSQRSSMATVVASLQHMMKSVNFFEMPMSSALLLSVLLTFLVCLLLIVIISMSVHVYRRRAKSSSRVRHLTAAARMRHAHLVAAAAASAAAVTSSGAGTGSSNAGSSPGYGSSHSSSSSSSSSSSTSPVTTHSMASPGQAAAAPPGHYSQRPNGGVANRKSPAEPPAASQANCNSNRLYAADIHAAIPSTMGHKKVGVSGSTNHTSPTGNRACSSAASDKSGRNLNLIWPLQGKHEQLGQLKISISSAGELEQQKKKNNNNNSNHLFAASNNQTEPTTKLNPLYLDTPPRAPVSLKSPLSSYRSAISSTLTDDSTSSLANCGHYSVNGTMELNPRGPPAAAAAASRKNATKLERAINDLVGQGHAQRGNVNNKLSQLPTPRTTNTSSVAEQQQQELEQLTRGKPGVRAYRPLPMMNSLVRPLRKPQQLACGRGNKVAPFEQLLSSHQQRIEQQEAAEQRHQLRASTSAAGLMALVRESIQLGGTGGAGGGPTASGGVDEGGLVECPQIRWPGESIPHKIKKLTWDDEMSCCDSESMLGMDFNNNNNDNNSRQEQYDGHNEERPLPEQDKFLFSLNSHMQLPSLNQQQQQQQQQSAAPSMDANPNLRLNLESHQQQNHQNNCLDYTIVESSQFHVDSLASVDMRSIMSPRCYGQDTMDHDQQQRAHSTTTTTTTTNQSQNATTFKLNQNYQDLKLMTTAVL